MTTGDWQRAASVLEDFRTTEPQPFQAATLYYPYDELYTRSVQESWSEAEL